MPITHKEVISFGKNLKKTLQFDSLLSKTGAIADEDIINKLSDLIDDEKYRKSLSTDILSIPFKDWGIPKDKFTNNGDPEFVECTVGQHIVKISNREPSRGEFRGKNFIDYVGKNKEMTLKRLVIEEDMSFKRIFEYTFGSITSISYDSSSDNVDDLKDMGNAILNAIKDQYKATTGATLKANCQNIINNWQQAVGLLQNNEVFRTAVIESYQNKTQLASVIAVAQTGQFTKGDWQSLQSNEKLQKAVIAVSQTGPFTKDDWKQLKSDKTLQSSVIRLDNKAENGITYQQWNNLKNAKKEAFRESMGNFLTECSNAISSSLGFMNFGAPTPVPSPFMSADTNKNMNPASTSVVNNNR